MDCSRLVLNQSKIQKSIHKIPCNLVQPVACLASVSSYLYRFFSYVLVTFIYCNAYLVMLCQLTIYICLLFSAFNLNTDDEALFFKFSKINIFTIVNVFLFLIKINRKMVITIKIWYFRLTRFRKV